MSTITNLGSGVRLLGHLVHQLTATPFLFVATLFIMELFDRGWKEAYPGFAVLLHFILSIGACLMVGIIIGLAFPIYARLGYWSWLLPGIPLLAILGMAIISADFSAFDFLKGNVDPNIGPGLSVYFGSQACSYALGLRIGVLSRDILARHIHSKASAPVKPDPFH